jgi:hypothetical protein
MESYEIAAKLLEGKTCDTCVYWLKINNYCVKVHHHPDIPTCRNWAEGLKYTEVDLKPKKLNVIWTKEMEKYLKNYVDSNKVWTPKGLLEIEDGNT